MTHLFRMTLLSICIYGAIIFSSQAATVYNLSDHIQLIEMRTAEGWKPFVIQPSQKFQRMGNVWVRFNGRERFIEFNEEFVIWSDTTFGPQRRVSNNGDAW